MTLDDYRRLLRHVFRRFTERRSEIGAWIVVGRTSRAFMATNIGIDRAAKSGLLNAFGTQPGIYGCSRLRYPPSGSL